MKTAISVPDEIFEAAEELADELGVSRSRLYAQAVAEFVAHHRTDDVTERLNKVYANTESRLDPVLEELQVRSISRDEW
jgi:hypothetical protein